MNAIISQKNINPLASIAEKLKMNSAYRGNKRRLESDTVDSCNSLKDVVRKLPRMKPEEERKSQQSGTLAPAEKSPKLYSEKRNGSVGEHQAIPIKDGNMARSTISAGVRNSFQENIIGGASVSAGSVSVGIGNVWDGKPNGISIGESGSACSFDGLRDDMQGPTSTSIGVGKSAAVGCEKKAEINGMLVAGNELQTDPSGQTKTVAGNESGNTRYNLRRRPVPVLQAYPWTRTTRVSSSTSPDQNAANPERKCYPRKMKVSHKTKPETGGQHRSSAPLKECSLVIKRLTPAEIAEYKGKAEGHFDANEGPNAQESKTSRSNTTKTNLPAAGLSTYLDGSETDCGMNENQDTKRRPVLIAIKGKTTRSTLPRACKYIPLQRTQAGKSYSSGSETDELLNKDSTISRATRKRSHALETPPTVGVKQSRKINKNVKRRQQGKTQRYLEIRAFKNNKEHGKLQKNENTMKTSSHLEADIKSRFAMAAYKSLTGITSSAMAPTVAAVIPNKTASPNKAFRLQASLLPMTPSHWRQQLGSMEGQNISVSQLAGSKVINDSIDLDPQNIFDMELTCDDEMRTNGGNKRNSVEMPNVNGNLLDCRGVQKLHSGGKVNRRFGRKYSNFPYQYRNRVGQLEKLFMDSPATAVGDETNSAECEAAFKPLPPASTEKMEDADSAIEDVSDDGAPHSHNTRYVIIGQAVNDRTKFIRRARKLYSELTEEEISSSRRTMMPADKLTYSPLDIINANPEPEIRLASAMGQYVLLPVDGMPISAFLALLPNDIYRIRLDNNLKHYIIELGPHDPFPRQKQSKVLTAAEFAAEYQRNLLVEDGNAIKISSENPTSTPSDEITSDSSSIAQQTQNTADPPTKKTGTAESKLKLVPADEPTTSPLGTSEAEMLQEISTGSSEEKAMEQQPNEEQGNVLHANCNLQNGLQAHHVKQSDLQVEDLQAIHLQQNGSETHHIQQNYLHADGRIPSHCQQIDIQANHMPQHDLEAGGLLANHFHQIDLQANRIEQNELRVYQVKQNDLEAGDLLANHLQQIDLQEIHVQQIDLPENDYQHNDQQRNANQPTDRQDAEIPAKEILKEDPRLHQLDAKLANRLPTISFADLADRSEIVQSRAIKYYPRKIMEDLGDPDETVRKLKNLTLGNTPIRHLQYPQRRNILFHKAPQIVFNDYAIRRGPKRKAPEMSRSNKRVRFNIPPKSLMIFKTINSEPAPKNEIQSDTENEEKVEEPKQVTWRFLKPSTWKQGIGSLCRNIAATFRSYKEEQEELQASEMHFRLNRH